MIMKVGTVFDSVKNACMHVWGHVKLSLQWSINRKVPSNKRFKSRWGCGFQTRGLDSVADNERWDCVGFCKNACMHVWGHVKLSLQWSINRNVSSSKRFKSRRGCGFQTRGLDSVGDNEKWDCVGFCKNACMHVWGHVNLGCNGVLIETFPIVKGSRAKGGVASKLGD